MRDWTEMTVFERIAHVALHADQIFVRAQIDGKWQSVALSDLPDDEKFSETRRLVMRGAQPTRLVRREE